MVDQSTKRPFEPFVVAPNMESVTELNKEFAGAISEVSQVYLEGVREFQSEMFRFAAYRTDENSVSGRNLFQTQQLSDLVDLQQSWLQRFSEQYMSETERLLHLMQRTAETAWAPFFNYEKRLVDEADKTLNRVDESCEQTKPARKKSTSRKA